MTWISFFSYLCTGYAVYYLLVILMDSRAAPGNVPEASPVLTFSETVEPEKILLEDFALSRVVLGDPPSTGLGGVTIKSLFDLARQDAIQYTRSVSF